MSDYFGQSPDGYQKPLYAASNFSDVVDKPAALVTLGAASADDVLKAANPIGTIIAFYGSVAPYGYLPCSGQTVSSSTFPSLVAFLGGTTSATLPDLRGEFLRGWDNGRGVDLGRAIRTAQIGSYLPGDNNASDEIVYVHNALDKAGLGWDVFTGTPASGTVRYTSTQSGTQPNPTPLSDHGGAARPRNVSVLYCIKAYDSPVNAGILNVATLASEMALKTALTDFTGTNQSKTATGWQKLPGGMILQWGAIAIGDVTTAVSSVCTLPLAFPNAHFQTYVTASEVGSGNWVPYVITNSKSLTGFNYATLEWSAVVQGATINYLSIGY
jgi:phage-related tail fiber protein